MNLDVRIFPSNQVRADADLILRAECLGFAAAWVVETGRNPFFSLTIAAKATSQIQLGALGAAAFPRSPMVSAQIAWDLARQSGGRFRLGLQAPADYPDGRIAGAERMREYLESLRAIWHTFQTDARLRYRGEHYTFRLMAPFFNPGPIEHPDIPVYLAGLDPAIAELAGSHCQGLQVNALHTADYLSQVVKPSAAAGLMAAGRAEPDFSLAIPVLIGSGLDDESFRRARLELKQGIASAANSPEFRRLAGHHKWDIDVDDLNQSTWERGEDRLDEMIPDEIIEAIAIVAEPQDLLGRIRARYAGLADRVSLALSSGNSALIEAIMASR